MSKDPVIRSMRNLKSFRTRFLEVVPQKESRLTLLDDLGSLWDEFTLIYDEFEVSLDGMETNMGQEVS